MDNEHIKGCLLELCELIIASNAESNHLIAIQLSYNSLEYAKELKRQLKKGINRV